MTEHNTKTNNKRDEKTSLEQKELYVSFMEANEVFRNKKPSDKSIEYLWDEITNLLNNSKGPIKSKSDWKKVFDNWRYVTNFKARAFKASINKTGGGSNDAKPLTDLENRAMECWGKVVIEGHKEVQAVGFQEAPFEIVGILQDIEDPSVEMDISDAVPSTSKRSNEKYVGGRLTAGDKEFKEFAEQTEEKRSRARSELNEILKEISVSMKEICQYLKIIAERH